MNKTRLLIIDDDDGVRQLLTEALAVDDDYEVAEAVPNGRVALERDGGAVRLQTHQGPPENSCRPSVDVLLRSAVEVYGAGVLAVILTGMGQDGLRGCESVRGSGGQVVVQDEPSSVVWGMPGFVARAGLADEVLSLERIGAEIVNRVRRSRNRSSLGVRPA
jgi:two-component system, chemotaxis family, protein-glutamate methylesterase/glutaminase